MSRVQVAGTEEVCGVSEVCGMQEMWHERGASCVRAARRGRTVGYARDWCERCWLCKDVWNGRVRENEMRGMREVFGVQKLCGMREVFGVQKMCGMREVRGL